MSEYPQSQRTLRSRSRGPNSRALPPITDDTEQPNHGEHTNAAALNNLLSPLPRGPSDTLTGGVPSTHRTGENSQHRAQTTMRPISGWQSGTSTSDAAMAEPEDEVDLGSPHATRGAMHAPTAPTPVLRTANQIHWSPGSSQGTHLAAQVPQGQLLTRYQLVSQPLLPEVCTP